MVLGASSGGAGASFWKLRSRSQEFKSPEPEPTNVKHPALVSTAHCQSFVVDKYKLKNILYNLHILTRVR